VLIILANRQDEAAMSLPTRWQSHDTHVLTPEGLSVRGWRYEIPPSSTASRAVVGHREISSQEITGVLTRIPCVSEQDLPHFMEPDRAYAATEMTAFLMAWLSDLDCSLLNRPTPGCLSGPGWRPEQWVRFAAHLGIPVEPVCRRAPEQGTDSPDSPATEVVVVGDRYLGAVDPVLADRARLLARASGVNLLVVYFSGPDAGSRFLSVSLWPDLWKADVADAILDYFQRRTRC
jgi:hypothetical protein